MEVRTTLQTIGLEAAVLGLVFAIAFAAIRISVAERKAQAGNTTSEHPSV